MGDYADVIFKYSVSKFFVRIVVGLVCLAALLLLHFNEPLWRFIPYLPESAVHVLLGRPDHRHNMSQELREYERKRRQQNLGPSQEAADLFWQFTREHGFEPRSPWHLSLLRSIIMGTLFVFASRVFYPHLITNKRIFLRLNREQLCYYRVWPVLPVTDDTEVAWGNIMDIEFSPKSKLIIVSHIDPEDWRYSEMDEKDRKKTLLIKIFSSEGDAEEIFQEVERHWKLCSEPKLEQIDNEV